jgi:hypothetical protein
MPNEINFQLMFYFNKHNKNDIVLYHIDRVHINTSI